MPYIEAPTMAGKKRKRIVEDNPVSSESSSLRDVEPEILQLELQIKNSRKHYNNIAKLLSIAKSSEDGTSSADVAVSSLCRVFSRLFADGSLQDSVSGKSEKVLLEWLKTRLQQYVDLLFQRLSASSGELPVDSTTYIMTLVRYEGESKGRAVWTDGVFARLVSQLLSKDSETSSTALEYFLAEYFAKFWDVRYYSLAILP
jgi:U3 small nucleolar RNA-associated protein 19